MLEQTTAGSLLAEGSDPAAVRVASRGAKPGGEKEQAVAACRLRSSGSCEVQEAQKYMWRRLFRIVDHPERPPIVLDCESLGSEATERIAKRFWDDPQLWGQRNLILTASAMSAWEELVARCRIEREDLIGGDNWGILIFDEPDVELPALLRTAANLDGWIVTTGRTLCEKTKRIRCSGALADAKTSLFGKRDSEMERLLGIPVA